MAIAKAGQADIVTVGNETLLTGALTESQLLAYIAQVKAQVPASVQVSTVETWNVLVDHPNVIAAVDVVLPNIYPFCENSPASSALATLESDYAQIRQASGAKQLMITESGWPSGGSPPAQAPFAIPSPEDQLAYFVGAEPWAKQNEVVMIWFAAFSEPWKAATTTMPRGVSSADGVAATRGLFIPALTSLSATLRRTGSFCSASHTSPMPPSPIFCSKRYRPATAPADSGASVERRVSTGVRVFVSRHVCEGPP